VVSGLQVLTSLPKVRSRRKVVVGTSKDTQKFWIFLEGLRGMKIEVGLTHSGTIPVPLTGRPES
jgi:hypothetical protein